jgi:hypothetical protein
MAVDGLIAIDGDVPKATQEKLQERQQERNWREGKAYI